jgi:hypothetical protein
MLVTDQIIGNPLVPAFVANNGVQQHLENDYSMEYLGFRLTGQLVLAGYSGAPTKFVESIENLIQNLSLQATGSSGGATSDQLVSVDAALLYLKTRLYEGTAPTRTDVSTANGTYLFETNFKHHFADPRSNVARLTTMHTELLSALVATYQFGDQTTMVTGGAGGTATLSSVQLTVRTRQILGLTPPAGSVPYVKLSQRKFNILASQNLFDATAVPHGTNILRRQFFKGMVGPNGYADPSDALFGATGKPEGPHIQLVLNNATTKLDQVYQQIRADNKEMFGVETIPTGYAVYEPARSKRLRASIPMQNVGKADNYIDLAYTGGSTNTLAITDEEICKVTPAQWAAS